MREVQEVPTSVRVPYALNDLRKMSPEDRKRFARAILLKVLEDNPDGMNLAQIERMTGLDRATVSKHLDYLVAVRELYRRQFGLRTMIYFPNGRIMHPTLDKEYPIGDKYYAFSYLENPFGRFLYIQEKTKDEYNIFSVTGGVVVRAEDVDEFADAMKKVSKELEVWQKAR